MTQNKNVSNYLLDQAGDDWESFLTPWFGLVPAAFTVWLVNRFGDVFFVTDEGFVCLLDVGGCTFEELAKDKEEFFSLMDADENANHWLMIPLVDRCVSAGLVLGPGQCYRFKIPPLLGGSYELENLYVGELAENYAFLSDLNRQTRKLPDGATVKLVIK